PGIAAQPWRNRPRQRRSSGPAGYPYELLRSARHESHGGGDPPDDGYRGALAGKPQAWCADGAAVSGEKARLPRRRRAERRAVGGFRAAFLADGLPPDLHLPDRRRRRSAAAGQGDWEVTGGGR